MNLSNVPITPEKETAVGDLDERIDHVEQLVTEEAAARKILAEQINCIAQIVTKEIAAKGILDQRIERLEATITEVISSLLKQGVVIKGTENVRTNRLADGDLFELLFPDLSTTPKPKDVDEDWEIYE